LEITACPYGWEIKREEKEKMTFNKKDKKENKFRKLTDIKTEYEQLFDFKNGKKYDIRENALKKAWKVRNFEIDKFWQRSAFFWGFIALIFTGYFTIVTGKHNKEAISMYLDFYLILLGLIFSVAWFLVIRGSKQWQENWEKHIDYLEDEITGPLYKTIYYKGETFYSVSRIISILAVVVIVTWVFLLLRYLLYKCNFIICIIEYICNNINEFILFLLPFLFTIFCIGFMLLKGRSFDGEFSGKEKDEAFYIKKDYAEKPNASEEH